MRLSVFNQYVENCPAAGETLVHNTFSGAYVVLDNEVLAALRKADRSEVLSADESDMVGDPDLSDPAVAIVVESRSTEEAEFRAWFERKRSKPVMEVTLGINLACNFDCPYCSQAKVLDGTVMTEQTADQTASWLADRAIAANVSALNICFVGGEPLLHPGRIERIARGLGPRLAETGIAFAFMLTTNGYFLDEAMLDRLCPLGLRGAQITLDGDQTTHAKTRVSKKGEDTFARVFAHAIAASRRIDVTINGNYQSDTVSGFEPLIAELSRAGLPPSSRVRFTPALQGLGSVEGAGSGSCTFSRSDMSRQIGFNDALMRAGFEPIQLASVGPCEFHDRHAFAIDPDGTIYKCPGFLGHRSWGIGDVESGLTRRYDQMLSINPQRECGGCGHRPNCAGGCVAAQWIALGRPEGVNCEHAYLESVTPAAVTRAFLLATSDSREAALDKFPPSTAGKQLDKFPPSTAGKQDDAGARRSRRAPGLRVIAT